MGHQEITLHDLNQFLDLFDELGLDVWLDGGWGVDALLGGQTRRHSDLDIVIVKPDVARLVDALRQIGFVDLHTDDRSHWNFVMGTKSGKLIDFHVIEIAEDGQVSYGSPDNPSFISQESLQATGAVATGAFGMRKVRCLSAEYQVHSHAGYQLKQTDIDDVRALSKRFGIPLLPEQEQFESR